ncbi:MAG: hypothetical protein RIE77_01365 [Phycisphaerales bacterium]
MPALTACALFVALGSASGGGAASLQSFQAAEPDPTALPLLGEQRVHFYVQEAYEGFSPQITDAVADRYAELVDAGMDCSRHLLDWADLEPSPGVYDLAGVIEALDHRIDQGAPRQFVNITVIDTGGPEALPQYVQDLLAQGARWDDPRITGPFGAMLEAIVPAMVDRGVYMLGFANEASGYYEDEPAAAASFAGFVQAAIDRTRTIEPALSTTVVFAGTSDASIPALMPLIDVATFNWYAYEQEVEPSCRFFGEALPLWRATGPDGIPDVLDEMMRVSGDRFVCIQEIGQATGWTDRPTTLGPLAGEALQAQVIEAMAEAVIERRHRFRTVSLWTLNDHTPAGMQYVVDAILAEGLPTCYAENVGEIFGPTGIVESTPEARRKPAFESMRRAIAEVSTK